MKSVGALVLVAALCAQAAEAQSVTRLDLARAVAKLDEALSRAKLSDPQKSAVSAAFDRASLAFLAGGLRASLEQIERLRIDLLEAASEVEREGELAAAALRIVPAERWGGRSVQVGLQPLFSVPELAGRSVRVDLFNKGELGEYGFRVEASTDVAFDEEGWTRGASFGSLNLIDEQRTHAPLSLDIHLGGRLTTTLYTYLERSPSDLRRDIDPYLDILSNPSNEIACRVLAARAALLVDEASPERTHEFLIDPRVHYDALMREMAALHRGDPYVERPGHLWRPILRRRRALPVRLYAPESIVDREEPVPLVVAFHGAGADESFFVELRGICDLVGLADEREFLLVCPRTPDWFYDARAFTALVDEMDRCYGVDRTRVYALGHSMGAACVGSLLKAGAVPLAGAAFLAGAGDPGERDDVPLLFVAGERDPLIPPARVRAAAESHSGAFVEVPGLGHTFVLGPGLALALEAFDLTPRTQK